MQCDPITPAPRTAISTGAASAMSTCRQSRHIAPARSMGPACAAIGSIAIRCSCSRSRTGLPVHPAPHRLPIRPDARWLAALDQHHEEQHGRSIRPNRRRPHLAPGRPGKAFLLIHLPDPAALSAAIRSGVWLFFVQHQFEHTKWAGQRPGLEPARGAALHGSSHLRPAGVPALVHPPISRYRCSSCPSSTAAASPTTGCRESAARPSRTAGCRALDPAPELPLRARFDPVGRRPSAASSPSATPRLSLRISGSPNPSFRLSLAREAERRDPLHYLLAFGGEKSPLHATRSGRDDGVSL